MKQGVLERRETADRCRAGCFGGRREKGEIQWMLYFTRAVNGYQVKPLTVRYRLVRATICH